MHGAPAPRSTRSAGAPSTRSSAASVNAVRRPYARRGVGLQRQARARGAARIGIGPVGHDVRPAPEQGATSSVGARGPRLAAPAARRTRTMSRKQAAMRPGRRARGYRASAPGAPPAVAACRARRRCRRGHRGGARRSGRERERRTGRRRPTGRAAAAAPRRAPRGTRRGAPDDGESRAERGAKLRRGRRVEPGRWQARQELEREPEDRRAVRRSNAPRTRRY